MAKKLETTSPPTHEEIAAEAYNIYLSEGCIDGRDLDHWLQAEARLMAERQDGSRKVRKPTSTALRQAA
ncbi:MAG: DUF2934 domain-containing protein [Verrucomicrobiota bacterium]|jgi:hypothetical protein